MLVALMLGNATLQEEGIMECNLSISLILRCRIKRRRNCTVMRSIVLAPFALHATGFLRSILLCNVSLKKNSGLHVINKIQVFFLRDQIRPTSIYGRVTKSDSFAG